MAVEAPEGVRIPVWLDVDTGHDDAYALLLAAHDSRTELLGVSTVHGNAPLEQTTYNTRSILEALGRRDVRVHPGSAKPTSRSAVHAADIHGVSGLDGVTLLPEPVQPAIEDVSFLDAMYHALATTPANTAWLISTGTLTNIGLLFQKYPYLAVHIKGLSIMGGAIGGGFTDAPMGKVKGEGERFGNLTAFAEFNVRIISCDPEAAQSIFTNPILAPKTTLIPLDVTHQVLGTAEVRHGLLYGYDPRAITSGAKPSPVRALFTQILSFFAHTYAEVFALTSGPPLHDPLAVAAAIEPETFNDVGGERFLVDIVTKGVHAADKASVGELGRTKVTKLPMGQPGVRIPRGLDVTRFWYLTELALRSADATTPMAEVSWGKLREGGVV
ncbi:Inosine/uridine-preferring nucleoside hydrolase [Cenococcum geophilum 1.58]|uniref:Inosine/uridine-preferring nucleoside hydrolase n=1 Tax=Cenococcum geophilum 1.58 TaxID=794803 RepID=UPI00358FC8F6|nr:Inosine/uridine-preferring nucleoside hydrolase [Cenococcum geophilum 1.58]